MDKIVKHWLERSKYDLDTAKVMFQARRYLYVAFMCQQSAEKMLKAIISHNGKRPAPVHSLLRLAELAGLELKEEERKDFYNTLSAYCINARYAEYKERLSEICNRAEAERILEQTEKEWKWLRRKTI
ncbi:HEPN domain-containing protein [candidate division TA06 bacterium]|uniref:HEPN domain-containing protein n=1 Tax=candidate division TA06 bacterium TaxID=2250710 RepID=A0A933MJ45_UNCT6|nr:HEPN domain-containing protein [candidate division TA06 bacterium]